MADERPRRADEKRVSEPEIIPPDRSFGGRLDSTRVFFDERGGSRIYVAKIGPLGVILLSLMIALIVIAALVLFLGAMLIWLPVVGLLVGAGMIATLLRGYFRRRL